MKYYSLVILIYLSVQSCFSQPGYSKMYDFDLAASFHNVILVDDTLIIAGTAIDEESNQWGALFVKMDTLGNVLDYRLHLDMMSGQYAFEKGYSIILTSDGGYLFLGVLFNRESFFVLKLHSNGDLEHFWEYPEPPNNLTNLPNKIIEVHDGYMIFSRLQKPNGKNDIYLTKINFEGEIMWEESYGAENGSQLFGSAWKQDDNTIVIGATKLTTQIARPPPNTFYCSQNWIFAIDSLGAVKWDWRGEPCDNGANIKGLQPTPDGGWIYVTSRLQVYDQWTLGYAPVIMKRDSEFNLVWKKQLADSYNTLNNVIDLKPSSDTNWVGVGDWILPEPYNGWSENHIYTPACLYKLTNNGDSLWIRCDTVPLESGNHTLYHEYGGLVTLFSGSTIAVGDFKEQGGGQGGQGGKSWAWVVKVDKDGCMEELCTITGVEDLEEDQIIHVFPNPVENLVQINTDLSSYSIRLLSIEGRILKKWTNLLGDSSIDISEIEKGTYFLEFKSKENRWTKKIVKI